jgi:crossover junction endodeoxyribonuclease RuvC
MIYIGIDPGASGGIACIWESGQAEAWSFKDCTEADIYHRIREFGRLPLADDWYGTDVFACIEKVGPMPGNGVTGMFKFGRSYGFLRGLLIALQICFDEVAPQTWQKSLGCMSKGDKNVTKAKAQQLFTQLKITHATADALLIAEFARRSRTEKVA